MIIFYVAVGSSTLVIQMFWLYVHSVKINFTVLITQRMAEIFWQLDNIWVQSVESSIICSAK